MKGGEWALIVYMITDGHGTYIRKDFAGRYSPVRNETLGDTWEQRSKAKSVLENQINKNIRQRYHIVEIEVSGDSKTSTKKVENKLKDYKQVAKQITDEEIEDDQINKWESGIDSLSDFVQDLEERKDKLSNKLSDVDKEITDIEHYIEFGQNFNAYEGWLAFSMLRHRLKKRRKIKDELHIVRQLSECKISSSMLSHMKEVIHELDDRKYIPRKLTNLFDKGAKK